MNVVNKEQGMTQNWVRIFFLSVSWPATSPDRPFSMYVLQVLQSTSPDIGLFDIDLSGPSPVAASAPLLFGITPTPAPLVWRGALPLPLTTIEPHLNQTPVGRDNLVKSTPKSWPSSVSPMGAINVKATTACSPRSRHGREPDTGQYHGDSSVAFTAGLPLSAWPRS